LRAIARTSLIGAGLGFKKSGGQLGGLKEWEVNPIEVYKGEALVGSLGDKVPQKLK